VTGADADGAEPAGRGAATDRGRAAGRRRRVGLGLLDQAVIALANAANPVLAAVLLDPTAAGVMLLALSVAYFVTALGRAFVGEVLLAHLPRLAPADRPVLVRNGAAAAGSLGLCAAAVLLGLWAVWPRPGPAGVDLSDLVWVAPALPAVLLQDVGRNAALAAGRTGRALALDLTWTGGQAVVLVAVAANGTTGGGLLAAWGVGGAAAAGLWLVRDRVNPVRGRPLAWLAETRHLSGWFTATALVGQAQVQAVAFSVVGLLSPAAYVTLRLAQVAILQPLQNLIAALMNLLVPRSSRLAGTNNTAGIRRQTRRAALALAALGAVVVLAAVFVAGPLVRSLLPAYAAVATLALPISLQAAVYLVQLPFTAAVRGMQEAPAVFGQYLCFAVASVAALVIGARLGDLPGAVWGLTAGAVLGFVFMVGVYQAALHRRALPVARSGAALR